MARAPPPPPSRSSALPEGVGLRIFFYKNEDISEKVCFCPSGAPKKNQGVSCLLIHLASLGWLKFANRACCGFRIDVPTRILPVCNLQVAGLFKNLPPQNIYGLKRMSTMYAVIVGNNSPALMFMEPESPVPTSWRKRWKLQVFETNTE